MALRDIYNRAIQDVIDGNMTKDDLWEIFSEQIEHRVNENKKLTTELEKCENKYHNLLTKVSKAYEDHKKEIGEKIK
jgi:hypothetical protein